MLLFELITIAAGAGVFTLKSGLYITFADGAIMFNVVFDITLLSSYTYIAWISSSLLMLITVLFMILPSDSSTNASMVLSNTSPLNVTCALFPVIT